MELNYRFATIREMHIYFKWTNDPVVRVNSFESDPVPFEGHKKWFEKKLLSENCFFYFFLSDSIPVGQVRIEIGDEETVIGISVDENFRGQSISSRMLIKATDDFLAQNLNRKITAYIKTDNQSSYKSFLKAGFSGTDTLVIKGQRSYKLTKQ